MKYDGYRVLGSTGQRARLKTRREADATTWFPEVTESLKRLEDGYVIDGEMAVLDHLDRSDFELLQDRARARRWREDLPPVTYCAFYLLMHRGTDCRG